jgi:AraC-like DNA-binding protein
MNDTFIYKFLEPDSLIADYVESIGMFHNQSDEAVEVVVLPDGRIDLFFSRSALQPFHIMLMGLETFPEQRYIEPQTLTFVIGFKPLAAEYILKTSIAEFVNSARLLPNNFWDFAENDLEDFNVFYEKATKKIISLLPKEVDHRKQKLFNMVYASNGSASVNEISEGIGWSSRQVNRYFNRQFGLSLKVYSTILRFRASLKHIAHGKLFPEANFTDQAYFIKEIKKFSGVIPKELSKNKDDRFILLSMLREK